MTPPIPLDEARALLLDGYGMLGSEPVALSDAAGRTLAEPIVARHAQPPATLSAMDGYAARASDIAAGSVLRIIGDSPAGAPFMGCIGPGECVAIATGGVVPAGADRILLQENAERDGDRVTIIESGGPPYIRPAGMDFTIGQRLLAAGTILTAAPIGLIAAAGFPIVEVARRPRVAIITSGDELREPGEPLGPGAMFNSAAFSLAALVEAWGGEAMRVETLPDDLQASIAALRAIEGSDLYLTIGGASIGRRDMLRPAFEALRATVRFERIAVVPGKPSWHARLQDGRPVLGLPGNPSSTFVCAHLLLKPILAVLTGRDPTTVLARAQLAAPLPANGNREAWHRATLSIEDGIALVHADPRQDSGLQTPLTAANALLRRPIGAPAAGVGELVDVLSLT